MRPASDTGSNLPAPPAPQPSLSAKGPSDFSSKQLHRMKSLAPLHFFNGFPGTYTGSPTQVSRDQVFNRPRHL